MLIKTLSESSFSADFPGRPQVEVVGFPGRPQVWVVGFPGSPWGWEWVPQDLRGWVCTIL